MDISKKGQMFILRMMIGIIVFIMVMIMITPLKESIVTGTNTSAHLNCSAPSASLTNAQGATCIVIDFLLFYMVGAALGAGMAYVGGKKKLNGIITAIVVFVVCSILINPLKDLIVYARDATHLNCADATISVASRMTCLVVDLWLFWFILVAISAAVAFIFIKKGVGDSQ